MENAIQDRLRYLLNRYADQQASREEEQELFVLLEDDEKEAIIKNLLEEMMLQEQFANIRKQEWEPVLKKVLRGDTINENGKLRRLSPWKWMAAAAVIIALVIGSYAIFFQKAEQPAIANRPVTERNDILPGKQGAILTLSNGKQIVLDNTKGNIANEGGINVINKDGLVSYAGKSTFEEGKEDVVYNTISTPKGRMYELTLQDGSKVWLNAASSIRFPTAFTGNSRVVEITGEAYFEVTHNAAKPFIVSVNDMQVEVLGTHFNINSYADEGAMKTTLLEGKVRVTRNGNIAILKPGEQVSTVSGGLSTVVQPDLDEVMAWKNGLFHFNNASLQEVMRQIVRWYDVDVVYQGNIPDRKFGGEISRNSNLSQVLKILEESKVHFTIEDKKLIVKP